MNLNPQRKTFIECLSGALLFVLLLFPSSSLLSQSTSSVLKPGTGYVTPPGTRITWVQKTQPNKPRHVRIIDTSADPWPEGKPGFRAKLAGSYIHDFQAYLKRYNLTAEERQTFYAQGYSNEDYHNAYDALEVLCRAGVAGLGPPTVYDCDPLSVEAHDFALRNPEGGGLYATYFALSRTERPVECPVCPPIPDLPSCPPQIRCPPSDDLRIAALEVELATVQGQLAQEQARTLSLHTEISNLTTQLVELNLPICRPMSERIMETLILAPNWEVMGAGRKSRMAELRRWVSTLSNCRTPDVVFPSEIEP